MIRPITIPQTTPTHSAYGKSERKKPSPKPRIPNMTRKRNFERICSVFEATIDLRELPKIIYLVCGFCSTGNRLSVKTLVDKRDFGRFLPHSDVMCM